MPKLIYVNPMKDVFVFGAYMMNLGEYAWIRERSCQAVAAFGNIQHVAVSIAF